MRETLAVWDTVPFPALPTLRYLIHFKLKDQFGKDFTPANEPKITYTKIDTESNAGQITITASEVAGDAKIKFADNGNYRFKIKLVYGSETSDNMNDDLTWESVIEVNRAS